MELLIGAHVSFTKEKQLLGSVEEAISYGANTFMIYTGAPQNTVRVEINSDLTNRAIQLMKKNNINIDNVVVHAPYIINLASPDETKRQFALQFLNQEINRTEQLGIKKIVLHPGSHTGVGIDQGIQYIISGLNQALTENTKTIICLETMAGKGTELGSTFNQLKQIINGIKYQEKIMVCLDTCHINDAGYNISDYVQVLEDFDSVIGLNKLGCVHINDSKNDKLSHKDRHQNIGFGTINFDTLIQIIYSEKLKTIPKILETPYVSKQPNGKDRTYPPYKFEIKMIKNKKFDSKMLDNIRHYYK